MNLITQQIQNLQLNTGSDTAESTLRLLNINLNPPNTALGLVNNQLQSNSEVQPLQSSGLNHQLASNPEPVTWTGKYSAFYTGQTPQGWDPIKEAYNTDIRDLKQQLGPADQKWLDGKHTIADLQKALSEAQATYQNRPSKSEIRSALVSCSQRVAFYAGVFDSLSQHYPEYVSLVWGSLKFLFTTVMNHEEILSKVSSAVTDVSHVIPLTELFIDLYRTPDMRRCVAILYAKVIKFVIKALNWYKESKIQHALHSIYKPYSISFKDIVHEIAECTRRVYELANTVHMAETRDINDKISFLIENSTRQSNTITNLQGQVSQILLVNQVLQRTILEERRQYQQLYLQIHTDWTRDVLGVEGHGYANAIETLRFCRSIRRRRRLKTPTQLPLSEISKLREWISSPQSSMLVAQGRGIRASSMDFAIDFIDAIRRNKKVLAIWALPRNFDTAPPPSLSAIMQTLVLQMLDAQPGGLGGGVNPALLQQMKGQIPISQWVSILEECASRFESVFIIIDASLLELSMRNEQYQAHQEAGQVVEELQRLVDQRTRGGLKVLIASVPLGVNWLVSAPVTKGIMHVFTDRGIPQEKRMWGPRSRALAIRQERFTTSRLGMQE